MCRDHAKQAGSSSSLNENPVRHTFFCIDGHTAGNPVRLVVGGAPLLRGASMGERRMDFIERFDWIRTGLCFEPRGHDMMSGGFLYPPTREDADIGILFIETSGCLPMCGHGTIGMITFGLEHGLITPREPGRLRVEVPAGVIDIEYAAEGDKVTSVRIRNVPAFLAKRGIEIEVPGFGPLTLDVSYGGNFYAIIEPQGPYTGLDDLGASRIVELSRAIRSLVRDAYEPVHPLDDRIRGVSHVLWADRPKGEGADGRNAVFYGERAIDRSPCGTGTSARLAHLFATGRLQVGDRFVHESYICSRFIGRVEAETMLGDTPAIIPSIEGSAIATGFNTIWIDRTDPFWKGFSVV
jgi:4-hydroxyproline epimerase